MAEGKCRRCLTADKVGYKYCAACRKIAERETNRTTQIIRRQKNYTPCAECKTEMSYTKYCMSCAQKVKKNRNATFYQKKKEIAEMCEECFVKPKWSKNSTTKYCEVCKVVVQKRKVEEKNKLRDTGKERTRKPRKQPVHKGVTLDPTKQQPTLAAPKLKKDSGEINPYFLRRGNPNGNGNSSGFTQFNQ